MDQPVVVIQYKKLEYLPPVMALVQVLKAIGRKVIYVGVESKSGREFLETNDIESRFMPGFNHALYSSHGLVSKVTNRIRRALAFYPHRRWLRRTLMDIESKYGELIIWHSEVASAALAGDWCLKHFPKRCLTIYELSDFIGSSWLGFSLRKCLAKVKLVVPEYNRACILKEYFRLKDQPYVLPNKPYWHPRTPQLAVDPQIEAVFDRIGNRPVLLYQGVWGPDRRDVALVLETIAQERPEYCLLCLPGCDAVERLAKRYANVFSLPRIPAPSHLYVTSRATVGIAIYNPSGRRLLERLNAVYCAPNKIYEYSGFGVPILGNNMAGLRAVEEAHAGLLLRSLDKDSILSSVDRLIMERSDFSAGATRFYESVDLAKEVARILSSFGG